MGNFWDPEENLVFYTFVIYNYPFIYDRMYQIADGSQCSESFSVTQQAENYLQNSQTTLPKRTNSFSHPLNEKLHLSGKTSPQSTCCSSTLTLEYKHGGRLNKGFYSKLASYFNERTGNPNRRGKHLFRNKMNKILKEQNHKENKGINSIQFFKKINLMSFSSDEERHHSMTEQQQRWMNGRLKFKDLIQILETNPQGFENSGEKDEVRQPFSNDAWLIEKQLKTHFGMNYKKEEGIGPLSNEVLNAYSWKEYSTLMYQVATNFSDNMERQKELFRRNLGEESQEKTTEFYQEYMKKLAEAKERLAKILIYSNIDQALDETNSPKNLDYGQLLNVNLRRDDTYQLNISNNTYLGKRATKADRYYNEVVNQNQRNWVQPQSQQETKQKQLKISDEFCFTPLENNPAIKEEDNDLFEIYNPHKPPSLLKIGSSLKEDFKFGNFDTVFIEDEDEEDQKLCCGIEHNFALRASYGMEIEKSGSSTYFPFTQSDNFEVKIEADFF